MATYAERVAAQQASGSSDEEQTSYTRAITSSGGTLGQNNPEYAEDDLQSKVAFAARMGFADTWRGVKQILGTDEEQMLKDQRRLNMYLQNEKYGGSIMAAYTAGLFADPVGWFLPGMKAKNLASATKAGLISGGIVGATGYADEESGMNRLNNTLIGIAGGGVLSPAMYKFNKTMLPALKNGYGETLKAIDAGKLNSDLNLVQKSIAGPVGLGYQGVKATGRVIKGSDETWRGKKFNNLGAYFIENYGLPEKFVKAKGNRRLMENKWAGDFNDVLEKFAKLKPEQDRALYRLMTDEKLTKAEKELLTPDIKTLGKEGRTIVNSLGKELVSLGLLDKKVFEANKKKYLYRSYEKTADPIRKRIIRDENNVGVIASEFVRRGRDKTFRARKGQTLAQRIAEEEANGYRVISKGKGQVLMNKDYTADERQKMGEIISSTFALAKTGKLMSNDVATFKFYDDITKMGDDIILPKSTAQSDIPADWKQIPNNFVRVGQRKTNVKEFGNLAGRYVSPEVHRDLIWANRMKKYRQGTGGLGGFGTLHHKMLQYWKRTKTSLNPVVHMNNVMSNVVLYDLVDANYKHLGRAGYDFVKAFNPNKANRVKSEDFRMAEKLGVFDADMMKRELTDFEIDTYKKYMKIGAQNDGKLLENMWESTKKFAGKTPMDKIYSAEDSVFRLALFKDHLAKNVREGLKPSDEQYRDAAKHARKYMLDYEIDAPGIELMRETAMPFISYTYRAAPIVAETLLKRPWKIAKWGLILNAANDLAADDAEYRTERKRQEELRLGYNVLVHSGTNTLIKLPNEKYLDVSRWIPAGDVLQTKEQGFNVPGLPAPLQPSGAAIGGIAKAVTGFDTFTKQQVPGVGSEVTRDELLSRATILGKEFIPFWNQGWNIWDAYESGGKKHPTKDDRTLNEALLGAVGIKVKTYDEKKMKMRVNYKYQNRISSLTKKIKKMVANKKGGRSTPFTDYDKEMDRLKAELKKISKEAREALKKAK